MRAGDFGFLVSGVLLNSFAQIGLKFATTATGPLRADGATASDAALRLGAEPAFWMALLCYGVSLVVWVIGLSRVPVSQAYPLLSLGYVVTAILACTWLGESLSPTRLAGTAVICLGVYLVARS